MNTINKWLLKFRAQGGGSHLRILNGLVPTLDIRRKGGLKGDDQGRHGRYVQVCRASGVGKKLKAYRLDST